MGPGDSAQSLNGNFNNTNSGPVYVATVTASISSVDKAPGAPAGTCATDDYTLAGATMTVNAEVPAGSGAGHLVRRDHQVQQQGDRQPGRLQGRNGQPRLHDRLTH